MAVFTKPRLPAIPTPEPNQAAMLACLQALKQSVEFLLGTRGDKPATRVYVQDTSPEAHGVGDLWITTQHNSTLSFWTGNNWQVFAVAHPDGTLHTT